jgi:hypothetical protein
MRVNLSDDGHGRGVSVQDADLLVRLNAYFDNLTRHVEQGQGWLIFNSARDRGARIMRLLLGRLDLYRPFVSLYHLSWRDFALHAYVSSVALPAEASLAERAGRDSPQRREVAIAANVASATEFQLAFADLLILSNINPSQLHETVALTQTAAGRAARRRAIIALTQHDPWSLAGAFNEGDPTGTAWRQFYGTMQETSLIAH